MRLRIIVLRLSFYVGFTILSTDLHALDPLFALIGAYHVLFYQKRLYLKSINEEDDSRVEKEAWPHAVVISIEHDQVFVTSVHIMQVFRMMWQYEVILLARGKEGRDEALVGVVYRRQIVHIEVSLALD